MSDPFASSTSEKDDEEDEQESKTNGFAGQLQTAVETANVSKLQVPAFRDGLDEVDNVGLLKEAYELAEDENKLNLIEDRLNELDAVAPMDEGEQSTLEEVADDEVEVETEEADDTEDEQNMTESEPSVEVDVSDIAPNALTADEAKETKNRWQVLVWGPPGVGKTHFSYTMPGPVCIVDTEGKADDISHKFDKEFFVWQPQDYDEAKEALHEAFDVLDAYKEKADQIGTIVVDSMSDMWTWSQEKYSQKYYGESADEARDKFDSAFGGGTSDWQEIKRYHNKDFRRLMVESDYNLCWTAQSKKDYAAMLKEDMDETPDKPDGEKNNIYKVDHIIHIRQNEKGVPVAELEKSGLIKHRFAGLEYPSFDKLTTIVDDIDEAETSPDPVDAEEVTEYDIRIVKGNPRFIRREDE